MSLKVQRRIAIALIAIMPALANAQEVEDSLSVVLDAAGSLKPLRTVVVAQNGSIVGERGYRGHNPSEPTNIKSASKSVISALVGIAIDKGILKGVDQKIAPLLRADLPSDPDPRLAEITIGNLLSMQAGLGRLSGANYGRWVSSKNWVRAALTAPFEAEPGGEMLYSTASTHLLSAILTRVSGRSTLQLARDWLGPQQEFSIAAWERDPQGIYLGGNQMAMSARSLLAFGEIYRNGGKSRDGRQLISAEWITQSFQARTSSRYTGHGYGYGWFKLALAGYEVNYGWGYGGQMIYVVPSLQLTVAMTSDQNESAARSGHREDLHRLLADIVAALGEGKS